MDSTRAQLRKLYQHSGHYLAGLVCSMALSFVSFPLFTRLFSVAEYGSIDLVQRLVVFAVAVAKFGLQNSALRFYDGAAFSSDRRAATTYYSTMCIGTAGASAVATLGFVLVVIALPTGVIGPQLKWLLCLASPLIFFRGLESILWAFFRIQERTGAYNVGSIVLRGSTIAAICGVLFWIERSLRGFFAGMVAAELAVVAVLVVMLYRTGLLKPAGFDRQLFRAAAVFGLPLILYEVASIALDSGDRLLVLRFLGPTPLGYYSAAYALSGPIQDVMLVPLNLAIVPIYLNIWKNEGPEKTIAFLSSGLDLFLMSAAGLFAVIAVTSRDLVTLVGSSKYVPAAALVPTLAGAFLIYATHVFLCAGLLIHKKTLVMAKAVALAAVVNVAANWVLLPWIGLQGAAVATLIANAFCIGLMSWYSVRLVPLNANGWAPARYAMACAIAIAAVWPLAFNTTLVNLIGRGALAIVVYSLAICLVDSRAREFVARATGIWIDARARRADTQSTQAAPVHVLCLIDQVLFLDGGGEGTVLKIVRGLPPDRYRASVGTFQLDPRLVDRFPCPVHLFPLRRTYDWNAATTAVRLARFIRTNDVRIVHTFFETSDLWGGTIAKLSGCRVISSRRDMGIQRSLKHKIAYRLARRRIDKVHAASEAVRQYAIQHDRLDPDKVITLRNGVDMEQVAEADGCRAATRVALGLAGASHVIVDVGWVRALKGTDVLIRAAAAVHREFPRAVFLIVGDHDDEAYFQHLQHLMTTLRLSDTIRFIGSRRDVFRVLKACDVFCHVSRSDGLSNALLEAMACGLPSVVSTVGGNPEAVEHGASGLLVASEDPGGTADCLLRLLRDPELSQSMGDRARKIALARFNAEQMVRGIAGLYDDLLNGACAARGIDGGAHEAAWDLGRPDMPVERSPVAGGRAAADHIVL